MVENKRMIVINVFLCFDVVKRQNNTGTVRAKV